MAGQLPLYVSTLFLGLVLWIADCSDSGDEDYVCRSLSYPSYGALVFNGSDVPAGSQPSWRENDTVTIVCAQGYRLYDTTSNVSLGTRRSITCDVPEMSGSGNGNGTASTGGSWSEDPEKFSCTKVDCGQSYRVDNGNVSFNNTQLFSTAEYSCDSGYQLTGGAVYTVCWWEGVWWPRSISCTPISPVTMCSDPPPTIFNGAATWTAGDPAPVGTTVDYTCDSGYELNGASVITCDMNGDWTSSPTCNAMAVLSSTEVYIVEGAGAVTVIFMISTALCIVSCLLCRIKIKQRQYVQDEEALAKSGAFTLSNPLVKDEDAAGNPLYLTPDELNEFEQQQ